MTVTNRPRKLLGELLLEQGLITRRQLSDGLRAQQRVNERLGRILVELGHLSELDMFRAVSQQDGLPFPARFVPLLHRARGGPRPGDAFARGRTRSSP
jgi:hypothetical protein